MMCLVFNTVIPEISPCTVILKNSPLHRHTQNITPHNVILEIFDFGDPEKFRVHTFLSRDSQASLENDVKSERRENDGEKGASEKDGEKGKAREERKKERTYKNDIKNKRLLRLH